MTSKKLTCSLWCFIAVLLCMPAVAHAQGTSKEPVRPQQASAKPLFQWQEVMIPMRDGVHLQTVILMPVGQKVPLPILLQRTPYGIPDKAPLKMPPAIKELAQDGYIFVFQNWRGRFKSEGVFTLSSYVNLNDPKATNQTTDAYDTIDWLVKHVSNNNGRVGIYGVSYPGWAAGMTLLHPNPALKAVSEQAAPVDQWMNDDFHRYGALRESYAFEYSVLEEANKNENTHFSFGTYDTYQWYLESGPLTNINAKYIHGTLPFWNHIMEHPNYDAFWKKEAWVNQLHASTVPNLNVAGFWDQEDPWGPWKIFRNAKEHDPDHTDFIVAGPWFHGQWQDPKADGIGIIPYGGHDTAREFRKNIEAPFFRYYLHGEGEKPTWQATTFQSGSNTWHTYQAGRRKMPDRRIFFCMLTARSLLPHPLPEAHPRNTANIFLILPIPSRIARGLSLPRIPAATGPPGRWPINASSIIERTFSALSARRSITTSRSPGRSQSISSLPLPGRTATSS